MKGTQTTLYFSKWHDSDLVSLYHQIGRKSFIKVMKESLRVLVRVDYEPTFTKSLDISPMILMQDNEKESEIEQNEEKCKSFSLIVSFASSKDVDILNLLYNVKPRKMSIFIKKAMRFLIGPYYVLGCMLEGDLKLNNAYLDRKLFFVNSSIPMVATKSEKPRKVKKENTKKEKDVVETMITNPSKVDSQPSNLDFGSDYGQFDEPKALQQMEGESSFIDDDDILSILENM